MKLINNFIFLLISTFSTVNYANQFYLGTDISYVTFDQVEFEAVNVNSILAGYTFENWSIEGSYNVSNTHNQFYGGDQKVNMLHLYSVYRSRGAMYYKIKLGISNERYNFMITMEI